MLVRWAILSGTLAIAALMFLFADVSTSSAKRPTQGLLPDLQTVIPKHLHMRNAHQRELLRFTNGIANLGSGDLRLRPEPFPNEAPPETEFIEAFQEIYDNDGVLVRDERVSIFEFHPQHNHWHLATIAGFEVRTAEDEGIGGDWGNVFLNDLGQAVSFKTGFCLLDSYKLNDNSPTSERIYWDCEVSYQGIQSGWVDQYHQPLEGQEIDITGAPEGIYYLVSTSNPEGNYIEEITKNNSAWVSFELIRDSKGNPKLEEIAHSACGSPGMCGEQSVNR